MAALIDATTGYGTIADFSDTSPQPDSADSGASLEDPSTFASFIWPTFALFEGRFIETGVGSKEAWGIFGE